MNNEINVANDIQLQVKVAAINAFFEKITGEKPLIENRGSYVRITWTDKQKILIREYIKGMLKSEPGKIRLDYQTTLLPAIWDVYGRYAVLVVMAAFFLGKKMGKK